MCLRQCVGWDASEVRHDSAIALPCRRLTCVGCSTYCSDRQPTLPSCVLLQALLQVGNFSSTLTIASLSGNVGSLGGGLPLTVNVGGAGVAAAGLNLSSMSVSVGGLPCPLTGYTAGSRTTAQLTCRAPAATPGMAVAEYWNLGSPGTVPETYVPFEALYGPPGASQQSVCRHNCTQIACWVDALSY